MKGALWMVLEVFTKMYLLIHLSCVLMFILCVMYVHCACTEARRGRQNLWNWSYVSHYVVLGTESQVFGKRSQCSLAMKCFSTLCRRFIMELWYLNSSQLGFFKTLNGVDENVSYVLMK